MSVSEFESDSSKETRNPMSRKDSIFRNDAIIDMEIEQTEIEMSRLLLKLESLKLEKMRISKMSGCSVVDAKKQSTNRKLGFLQKIQHSKQQQQQQRRGVSLCPAEIYSATKSGRGASKQADGVGAKQSSRRQSCFWKLGEIDELKVTKDRGGSTASVSPKPREPMLPKANDALKKKKIKAETMTLSPSVQPKRLFRDVDRSSSSASASKKKPPIQPCRIVASRFNNNQSTSVDAGVGKFRSLSLGGTESSRVKKRWEIPAKGEIVVYKSERESIPVVDEIAEDILLPKIRTVKCVP